MVLFFTFGAQAQTTVPVTVDSIKVNQDSIRGDITTTIKYSARDSIVFHVKERKVNMYGNSAIDYGDVSLKAANTTIDYATNLLSAGGTKDSTGADTGTPVFKQGAEMYTANQMTYNFKTKRGRTTGVVTKQGEGFLHAEVVKRAADEAIWASHARYTTCDLPNPHFYISSTKMKAYPGKKIFSGPFNLVFADIPTPLGFLFGYFPTPSQKKSTGNSGIIVPTFGETRELGFYLRQGGYYFAINDNIGVSLLGDIYSFGSWNASLQSTYAKRYAYRGNFSASFSATKYPDEDASQELTTSAGRLRRQEPRSFWLQWSHTPVSKPGGQFSASVRAGSNFYNRQNYSNTIANRLSPAFNSTIQYQRADPNSPVTFTISALQSQNSTTRQMDFTLPEMTLGVNRQYPFRIFNKNAVGGNFLQDIAIAYNVTASNRVTNAIRSNTLSGVNLIGGEPFDTVLALNTKNIPTFLRNAQYGAQHSFPISMNSIRVLKYFSLSPSVSYSATTYFKQLDYTYIKEANAVRIDTLNKFSVLSTYNASLSLTTQIFGMATINGKRLKAIRHKIQPSISYNYAPDLQTAYGENVQLSDIVNSTTGYVPTQYLSRYNGFLYGTPSQSLQSVISFGVQNNVEGKIKAKSDTADTYEKISLIDNFSFNGGYNFAADSFQFQPINAQFRTVLFKRLNIFSSANFDLYQTHAVTGRRMNQFLFSQNALNLARLTTANLNMSIDLNPEVFRPKKEEAPATNRPSLETDEQLRQQYVDFTIPWTFQVNFTTSYFNTGQRDSNDPSRTVTSTTSSLGFDGSLGLTDKWQITYSSGYDFKNKGLTITSINIHRDLHCWEMSIGWVPFGTYQSYSVNINARSTILRDLKISRNRSWFNR